MSMVMTIIQSPLACFQSFWAPRDISLPYTYSFWKSLYLLNKGRCTDTFWPPLVLWILTVSIYVNHLCKFCFGNFQDTETFFILIKPATLLSSNLTHRIAFLDQGFAFLSVFFLVTLISDLGAIFLWSTAHQNPIHRKINSVLFLDVVFTYHMPLRMV